MVDKSKLEVKFKKKIKELVEHNKSYYSKNRPKVSDSEYDKLKKELIDLESKFSFLKSIGSVNKIVGATPSNDFKKIKHLSPMLSLSNAFNREDMIENKKKVNKFLNFDKKNIELFCEPKIDGISATLVYEKGNLSKGLSRGDGTTGEDILLNLITISSIPKKIVAIRNIH